MKAPDFSDQVDACVLDDRTGSETDVIVALPDGTEFAVYGTSVRPDADGVYVIVIEAARFASGGVISRPAPGDDSVPVTLRGWH